MTKEELSKKIKELMVSKGLKKVFLSYNQTYINGYKVTSIFFTDDQVSVSLFKPTDYKIRSLESLHYNRFNDIIKELKDDKYVGYVKTNSKTSIFNITPRVSTRKEIIKYVQDSNLNIHIGTKDQDWKRCERCYEYIFDDDYFELNGKFVCSKCKDDVKIFTCAICGKKEFYFNRRSIRVSSAVKKYIKPAALCDYDGSNVLICKDCYDNKIQYCPNCGDVSIIGLMDGCDCRSHTILDYSYKPKRPKLLSTKKIKDNTLFLGFENECECHEDDDSDCSDLNEFPEMLIKELGNNVYCKEDGSLDYGFEIVTEPMTYEYILKNRKHFEKAFKKLSDNGVYSYKSDNTGFHIHLSKAAFIDKKHMINFAKVIYLDKELSSKIALRNGNTYCYYLSQNELKNIDDTLNKQVDSCDRYRAVNFSNSNTVEVRIYKGNLEFNSCLTYIQHVVSIFNYTASITKQDKDVSIIDYINYVNKNGRMYKELNSKIKKIIKGGK